MRFSIFYVIRTLLGLSLLSATLAWADVEVESPDIVLRGPASEVLPPRDQLLEVTARVDRITDYKSLTATSRFSEWFIGEVVAVESQNPTVGIVAFVEVTSIEKNPNNTYTVKFALLRQSRTSLMQEGDTIYRLDLSSGNPRYKGTTDLIIKRRNEKISSRYKPLFTQGVNIGSTAQSLWKHEGLVTWYGQAYFGLAERFTIGTFVPLLIAGSPNGQAKFKFFESDSNTFATGLSYTKIPDDTRSSLNLDFFWDSISSESVISHTYISLALYSFDQAEDTTAIRSLGTSTFQSGYEFILSNWDRLLVGPSYNFEKKAIGGYASYVAIWDTFHLAVSANATNVRSFKLSPTDGYYFFIEGYWRF